MSLLNDLKGAVRGLFARPLFALVAIATLAFGVGANTAIFSLAHAWLLRPLPVEAPDRLVNLSADRERQGWTSSNSAGTGDSVFSYPLFRDLERRQDGVARLAAHRAMAMSLAVGDDTRTVSGMLVSGSYFGVLGLRAHLGRLLDTRDDAVDGQADAVVVGYDYWQQRLGADPAIVGRTLRVNGQVLTVAGVAPRGFEGTTLGTRPEVYVPISVRWSREPHTLPEHASRKAYWLYVFGRLDDGVTPDAATARLNVPFHAIVDTLDAPLQSMPLAELERYRAQRLVLAPGARGQSIVPAEAGPGVLLLGGITGLVLLIACVNLANLMLSRGATRASEMAVRAAVGASRGRLFALLLAEAGLLALLGALAALPVAWGLLRLLASLVEALSGGGSLATVLMPEAVLFAFATASLTAILFGLVPALQLARTSPIAAIRGQSPSGGGRASTRFRGVLATVQVALSMALVVLAGLFSQSLANLGRVDLGLDAGGVLVFSVAPARNGYEAEVTRQLLTRIEDEIRTLPGVVSTGQSLVRLLSNDDWGGNINIEGFDAGPRDDMHVVRNEVGPGYFETLRMPLLAGRVIGAGDTAAAPTVAVVNRAFVRQYGLGDAAVGRRIGMGDAAPDIAIVGVVEDTRYSSVRETPPAQIFLASAQRSVQRASHVYVRTAGDPAASLRAVEQAVARVDATLPVDDLQTMHAQVDASLVQDRMIGGLSTGFAVLATLLAAFGLYGVLAYTLAQRTREFGLRQALGAPPARLRAMVFGQVGRIGLAGIAIGLVVAGATAHAARALLFGLDAIDPLTCTAAALLVAVVVFAAGGVPAWRASRVPPMEALRHD